MSDRLDNAEAGLAHLTRMVEDLSDVVAGQATAIERLERRVALLMDREAEREVAAGGTVPLGDEKPPHW
ncbi:SlyX family protein [Rhodovulum sp. YNF3179]|uniref:SlyX family protein n=1 Tax=Rhodovulum sp. YNF3179 TaxID=3425127 RepID=UPI003D337186